MVEVELITDILYSVKILIIIQSQWVHMPGAGRPTIRGRGRGSPMASAQSHCTPMNTQLGRGDASGMLWGQWIHGAQPRQPSSRYSCIDYRFLLYDP
jgi:hypothetical protein